MCTRFTLHLAEAALAVIAKALARQLALPEGTKPKYNITLTHLVPAVAAGTDGPEVRAMRWGFVPFYERGMPQMRMLPNAKAETAAGGTAFKKSVAQRRCLIPANGFYEWQSVGHIKYPHLFTLRDDEPFAFAGIWDTGADDSRPPCFAILTTEPNRLVSPIHNRMPVILTQDSMSRWIGNEPLVDAEYRELTRPLLAEKMQERPVNRHVSNSRNDGPKCLESPDLEPTQQDLFG